MIKNCLTIISIYHIIADGRIINSTVLSEQYIYGFVIYMEQLGDTCLVLKVFKPKQRINI